VDLADFALVAWVSRIVRGVVIARRTFANAREIIALRQPPVSVSRNCRRAMQAQPLVRAMNFVYFWLDFPLIVAVGLLLFWRERRHYTLLRDALLISGGMALACYYSFPVAPPRYLLEWGFVDTLAKYDHLSYQAQSMRPFVNPYAAVPSLHVGWSALLGATAFRVSRGVVARAAGVTLVLLQSAAVLVTGNHYFFDALIGLLVCVSAWYLAAGLQSQGYPRLRGWLLRQERASRRVQPSAG
jgi:hypothetical protein